MIAEPTEAPGPHRPGAAAATALAVVVVILLVAIPIAERWRAPVSPLDEGMVLVYPDLLLDGAVPGETFDSTFPPGTSVLVATSYLVFGERLTAERAAGAAVRILLLVAVALMLRRFGRTTVIVGVVAIALLRVTGGVAAYPFTVGISFTFAGAAAMVTATDLTGRRRTAALSASGLLLGFALACRVDVAIVVVLILGVPFVDLRVGRRWFLAGLTLGALPLWGQLLTAGPVVSVRKLLLEPAFVWGPHRRLPIAEASTELKYRLAVSCAITALVAVWAAVSARRLRGDERVRMISIAALAVPAVPYALQRLDVAHTGGALAVLFPVALVAMVTVAHHRWRRPAAGAAAAVLIGGLVLAPTSIDNRIVERLGFPTSFVTSPVVTGTEGRWVHVAPRTQESLQGISEVLRDRSSPGERLVVGTHDPRRVLLVDTYLYFLFPHLTPGTYYLEFNPGVVNGPNSHYADDVRAADWLILNSSYDGSSQSQDQPPGSGEAIEIVEEQFCAVPGVGPLTLYERCDRTS